MSCLSEGGVPCEVFLAPILPGITDAATSIEAVATAAKEHGTATFGTSVLQLASFVKEHYFGFVAQAFPDLLPRYERAYPGTNAPRDYLVGLEARVSRIRSQYGFVEDEMRRPDPQPARPPVACPRRLAGSLRCRSEPSAPQSLSPSAGGPHGTSRPLPHPGSRPTKDDRFSSQPSARGGAVVHGTPRQEPPIPFGLLTESEE